MTTPALKITYIPRTLITPDPAQPRTDADAELRDSIARRGIIQPITVRRDPEHEGKFLIIDGERRWRGAEGVLDEIPTIVRRDDLAVDDVERKLTQLVANTGKELPPLDEARAYMELLLETGWSIEELADKLGRPRSTVGDRVRLMELGPWIPLIESGEVAVSQAVQVLVPLRAVPADDAAKAIETARKDYRWSRNGRGISIHDFRTVVEAAYRPFLYPLRKTSSYEERPTFNTKDHDKECDCGRIKQGERVYCGNPGWWRSRHRKALAEKKKKAPKESRSGNRGGVKLYLPEGTPTVKVPYYQAPPSNIVALTDSQGQWKVEHRTAENFDPADLPLDSLPLVRIDDGNGPARVGTKDVAAVKLAREQWRERWAARRRELEGAFRLNIAARAGELRVTGPQPALAAIAVNMGEGAESLLIECAAAVGVPVPAKLYDEAPQLHWETRQKAIPKWIESLTAEQLEGVLSAFAAAYDLDEPNPLAVLQNQVKGELAKIQKRAVPWLKPSKAASASKPAKSKRGKQSEAVDAPPPQASAVDRSAMQAALEHEEELCEYCGEAECENTCTAALAASAGLEDGNPAAEDLWGAEDAEELDEEPVDG